MHLDSPWNVKQSIVIKLVIARLRGKKEVRPVMVQKGLTVTL